MPLKRIKILKKKSAQRVAAATMNILMMKRKKMNKQKMKINLLFFRQFNFKKKRKNRERFAYSLKWLTLFLLLKFHKTIKLQADGLYTEMHQLTKFSVSTKANSLKQIYNLFMKLKVQIFHFFQIIFLIHKIKERVLLQCHDYNKQLIDVQKYLNFGILL